MSAVSAQIESIIKERRTRLPQLDGMLARCAALRGPLDAAGSMLDELAGQCADNPELAEVCRTCGEKIGKFRADVGELERDALVAKKRFSRPTINIGFAGTKGTGKSFLLQKLSGLTDNEVPSADGMPTTAVQCVIANSPENRAHVVFHDERGFLKNRIAPFCSKLNLPAPHTAQEFQSMPLPSECATDREEILCQKLREYQRDFPSYAPYLDGTEKTVELADLRKFVAYTVPSSESPSGFRPSSLYLAVSKVDINCDFPRTDVKSLQLIDLPGLGELDPSLEARHTAGFKDAVDLCLFIQRPEGTRQDWDKQAQQALETLTENCPVSRASDFIIMVLNAGECKENRAVAMEQEARSRLGARYTIIRTSSSDSDGLSKDVLSRALHHLAEHLPDSDGQLFAGLEDRHAALCQGIANFAEDARRSLRRTGQGQDSEEICREAAQDACEEFSLLSSKILDGLESRVMGEEDVDDVVAKLDEIQAELDAYCENGLGEGSWEAWEASLARKLARNREGASGLSNININDLRVHISNCFSTPLDAVYEHHIRELQRKTVEALNDGKVLNGFLDKEDPKANLEYFLECLDAAELPMPQMRQAVSRLLTLKVEHNAQFYPRAYAPIRAMKRAVDDVRLDGSTLEEKIGSMRIFLVDIITRTATEIRSLLIEETRQHLFNILYVAYEAFEDCVIRDKDSDKEWIRLFKAYHESFRSTSQKNDMNYILNKTVKQLDALREHVAG